MPMVQSPWRSVNTTLPGDGFWNQPHMRSTPVALWSAAATPEPGIETHRNKTVIPNNLDFIGLGMSSLMGPGAWVELPGEVRPAVRAVPAFLGYPGRLRNVARDAPGSNGPQ